MRSKILLPTIGEAVLLIRYNKRLRNGVQGKWEKPWQQVTPKGRRRSNPVRRGILAQRIETGMSPVQDPD